MGQRNMRKAFSLEQKWEEDAEGETCTKNDGVTLVLLES